MLLKACILCGGLSRRMGTDKALLPHPSGGSWLTVLADQMLSMSLDVVVVTGHRAHADQLVGRSAVSVVDEPPPWNGPLQALSHVLSPQPGHPLLVVPVDMPCLSTAVLRQLIDRWHSQPGLAAVAHDGQWFQPLLGVYPSGSPFQSSLMDRLARGDRRWQAWLQVIPHQPVRLPSEALLNANCPRDLAALGS